MPTFEVKAPVGANQIWMRAQIREAVAEATRRGKLRPNSVDSITGENSGNNLGPGTPIIHFDQWEDSRDRDQADSQGRRLREHERAVLAAGRARTSRPRRPHARGRSQVHPARRLEGAGQGLQPRRRRRVHRRRSHLRLPARQGAAVPDARRRERGSEAGGGRSVGHGGSEPADRRVRWASAEGRRSSGARSACRIACPRASSSRSRTTAGRSGGSAFVWTPTSGAIASWLYRDGVTPSAPLLGAEAAAAGFPAHGPGDRTRGAHLGRADPIVEGRRRRARSRAACSPDATPCTRT